MEVFEGKYQGLDISLPANRDFTNLELDGRIASPADKDADLQPLVESVNSGP
jgi:hypothetical protein